MNITRLALENSRITVLAILLIIGVGISTFLSYPSAEDPTIVIRNASITASYPGMSTERVEDLITKPIESAMREIAEIDEIASTSKAGQAQVDLTVHDGVTDLDAVFQDIRNKASDLENELPAGTNGPFVDDEKSLTAIATIALWADGFSLSEMRDIARDLRDRLYTLSGIKKVQLISVQEEQIYLEIQPAKLAEFGLNPQQVFGALAEQNIIEPGGSIVASGRSVLIEPTGDLESIEELRGVLFSVPDTGRVARLDEVVDIRRDYVDPPKFPAFFNDKPAIVLSVSTAEGVNNIE
ncbi:MAG: efflux RND transporter permease subunit, partial [Geminicoccaceae bacterium]